MCWLLESQFSRSLILEKFARFSKAQQCRLLQSQRQQIKSHPDRPSSFPGRESKFPKRL